MRTRFLGRLAIAVLLAACLSLPSSARAEFNHMPFDKSEELAPGFNACMKQAKTQYNPDSVYDPNYSDYYNAVTKCYVAAHKYWNDILDAECKKRYEQDRDDYGRGYTLPEFRRAFDKYLSEGAQIVADGNDGGFGMDMFYTRFYAEETKRVVKMLRTHGIFEKPEENPLSETIMNNITSRQN